MNRKLKHLILLVFGLLLLFSTLFISSKSNNKEELKNIKFGYPIAFIEQDHSGYYSFYYFPTWDGFNFKDFKNTHSFSGVNFFTDWIIFFAVLKIIIYLLESLVFGVKKLFYKEKESKTE